MFALWLLGHLGVTGILKNVTIATFSITPSNIYDIISWFNFNLETSEWYPMKAYELYFENATILCKLADLHNHEY